MNESVAACPVLVARFGETSTGDRDVGRRWYPAAYELCHQIGGDRIPAVTVARVMAILSPRATWSTNVMWTRAIVAAFIEGRPIPPVSTIRNRERAWAELQGTPALSGQKVETFAQAIQGDNTAVTIDSWILRSVGLAPEAKVTAHRKRWITEAYHEAARLVGETPRDFQAIVWCALRGTAT